MFSVSHTKKNIKFVVRKQQLIRWTSAPHTVSISTAQHAAFICSRRTGKLSFRPRRSCRAQPALLLMLADQDLFYDGWKKSLPKQHKPEKQQFKQFTQRHGAVDYIHQRSPVAVKKKKENEAKNEKVFVRLGPTVPFNSIKPKPISTCTHSYIHAPYFACFFKSIPMQYAREMKETMAAKLTA